MVESTIRNVGPEHENTTESLALMQWAAVQAAFPRARQNHMLELDAEAMQLWRRMDAEYAEYVSASITFGCDDSLDLLTAILIDMAELIFSCGLFLQPSSLLFSRGLYLRHGI